MNTDSELLTAVKESFAGAHLRTPLGATIRRGRELRARRRVAGVAGAAAIAGAAGLTVAGLVPGGAARPAAPGTRPAQARLAAWMVTTGTHDTVTVMIRQLSDPAGLQRALRADGVPAAVAFQGGTLSDTPPLPARCRNTGLSPKADAQLQVKILGLQPQAPATTPRPGHTITRTTITRMNPADLKIAFTIHPAEIPKGIGLNLTVQSSASSYGASLGLVQASPACTGS
jgi:hypothetical protein